MTTSMNVGTGEWKMAVKNREYKTGEGKAGLKNIPFQKRLEPHLDELKWLYMELYDNQQMFEGLCSGWRSSAGPAGPALKHLLIVVKLHIKPF